MSSVRISHPGYIAEKKADPVVGRCTVAVKCRDGGSDIAVVFCSPNDQFVRKIGYKAVLERLESDPIKVEGIDFRTIPVAAREHLLEALISALGPQHKWYPHSFTNVFLG